MPHAHSQRAELADELAPILNDPANIEEMVALSRRGRPAVEAIGAKVAEVKPDLEDREKQHVGRLVRDILAARGLKPVRSARVRPGNLFSWGAVYGAMAGGRPPRREPADAHAPLAEKPSVDDWLVSVREIVAKLPRPLPSVDGFIAERHAEAEAER